MSEVRIAAEPRTEFGKGPSRRIRRANKVPAVLYGHGEQPRHFTLPGHELMLALKHDANALLTLQTADGDQLALRKIKNQSHSTFSRAYGNVTSTVKISRGAMDLDAAAEDKGAAFRMQDDGIAAGSWVGGVKIDSLYNKGRQKLSADMEAQEPLSDRGEEGEEEDNARWEMKKRAWAEANTFFTGQPPPAERRPRTVFVAAPSDLTLVRHLPAPSPFEHLVLAPAEEEEKRPLAGRSNLDEGAVLPKKRRLNHNVPASRSSTSSILNSTLPAAAQASSSPLPSSSFPFPNLSSSSHSPTASTPSRPTPVAARPPNPLAKKAANPFAKKPPPNVSHITPALAQPRPTPAAHPRRSLGLAPSKSSTKTAKK